MEARHCTISAEAPTKSIDETGCRCCIVHFVKLVARRAIENELLLRGVSCSSLNVRFWPKAEVPFGRLYRTGIVSEISVECEHNQFQLRAVTYSFTSVQLTRRHRATTTHATTRDGHSHQVRRRHQLRQGASNFRCRLPVGQPRHPTCGRPAPKLGTN